MGGLPLCELNQLELEFLFLCNFDLHVKLEDMQAYGDQLLTHALTQQCTLLDDITSPPLSPPCHFTTIKRKRQDDGDDDDDKNTTKIQRSEALLDRALIPLTKSTICNKIYSSRHHLDTMLSSYTHDC